MELVEGPTLADRIADGAVPLDEALPIAKQIAEALEAAHEQGIIHRDLKPANIKVRPDGTVKVLDFGLAKAVEPAQASGAPAAISNSPTITSPAMMTGFGVILGTAAYMSPEQAKGREADKRSDIWAFGVVLYEMLAGRRPFDGDDMTDVLGAVVRLEPNWQLLPSDVPAPIGRLVQSCLIEDRRQRVADISTARYVLDTPASLVSPTTTSQRVTPVTRLWRRAVTLVVVVLVTATVAGAAAWISMRPAPSSPRRFVLVPPAGSSPPAVHARDNMAITRDGARLVYVSGSGPNIVVRSLDQLEPQTIATTSAAPRSLFLSPDGSAVGFTEIGTLKEVPITGGPVVSVAETDGAPRGATWLDDGTIIFATASPATGLQRVSADGGETSVLTTPDTAHGEFDHRWPEILPGGQAVLYTITTSGEDDESARIALLDLRTGKSHTLISGSNAHYVAVTGHLIYALSGVLRAVRFDLRQLAVVGAPVTVLEDVGEATVANNGSLAYVPGIAPATGRETVVSVDRQGRATPLPGLLPDAYGDVRLSPHGTQLALVRRNDIWIYDFARGMTHALSNEPDRERSPLWSTDGLRVIYTSTRTGYPELFWRRADGTGGPERFFGRGNALLDLFARGWSADGQQLLFTEVATVFGIGQVAPERPEQVKMLFNDSFRYDNPSVSPSGHWIAFQSNASGRFEIYVERYPQLGSRVLISENGGSLPLWSSDGLELFFSSVDGRRMFAVSFAEGATPPAGPQRPLFDFPIVPASQGSRPYDLAPGGGFIVVRRDAGDGRDPAPPQINLVEHWSEELKRLVPTK